MIPCRASHQFLCYLKLNFHPHYGVIKMVRRWQAKRYSSTRNTSTTETRSEMCKAKKPMEISNYVSVWKFLWSFFPSLVSAVAVQTLPQCFCAMIWRSSEMRSSSCSIRNHRYRKRVETSGITIIILFVLQWECAVQSQNWWLNKNNLTIIMYRENFSRNCSSLCTMRYYTVCQLWMLVKWRFTFLYYFVCAMD